jgi:hypothetical protein
VTSTKLAQIPKKQKLKTVYHLKIFTTTAADMTPVSIGPKKTVETAMAILILSTKVAPNTTIN